jgi:hypothetical protein
MSLPAPLLRVSASLKMVLSFTEVSVIVLPRADEASITRRRNEPRTRPYMGLGGYLKHSPRWKNRRAALC